MAYVHREAIWKLTIAGEDVSAKVRPRLISLDLTEKRGTDADELDLCLSDTDGKLAIPPAGAVITLSLGWLDLTDGAAGGLVDKGTFKVDEREHSGTPDQIRIRARSADLTRAFRTRHTQTWSDTTLGQVLADVAGRNGLQPMVAPDRAAVLVAHLDQARESDAAFLARLGRLHDAVATVKAGRLLFMAVGANQTPGGSEIPPGGLTRASGDRHRWKAAERDAYTGVIATWHDRAGAQRHQVVIGTDANAKRLGRTYASEAAARRAADTAYKKLQRGKAEFALDLAIGRPDLYPGRKLSVSGFKAEIDATEWLIDEARHSLNGSGGLKTVLSLELGTDPPGSDASTQS